MHISSSFFELGLLSSSYENSIFYTQTEEYVLSIKKYMVQNYLRKYLIFSSILQSLFFNTSLRTFKSLGT